MAISRTVRRLSWRQSELRRELLRQQQLQRDRRRTAQRRRADFRRNLAEGIKGVMVILVIVGFFAIVYWLAIAESLPRAY